MPIGMIGSLIICNDTLIYMAVAIVLTGLTH